MSLGPDDSCTVRVELPNDQSAPAMARARTRSALGSWRLLDLLDPLLLVVSELVSNAVRHGRAPVGMLLRRTRDGVRVEVHDDASETGPLGASTLSGPDAESGRGLFLVDAVSSASGVQQIPEDGKVVWATLEEPPPT